LFPLGRSFFQQAPVWLRLHVLCSKTHFPFYLQARIECRQNLEGGKNGKDETVARDRARMFGTAIILVSLAFTFLCSYHSQTGNGMV
jgi:hypothetical protein